MVLAMLVVCILIVVASNIVARVVAIEAVGDFIVDFLKVLYFSL